MRKMGWREGEGLGKNKEGNKEPILVDFKTDRKGNPGEHGRGLLAYLFPVNIQGFITFLHAFDMSDAEMEAHIYLFSIFYKCRLNSLNMNKDLALRQDTCLPYETCSQFSVSQMQSLKNAYKNGDAGGQAVARR